MGGNLRQYFSFPVFGMLGGGLNITSVRLIQVDNSNYNRNNLFGYFLGVRVLLIEVSA